MAGEAGPPTDTLSLRLEEEPYRFDFFNVVRRLESIHADKPRIGTSGRPGDDPVRFCQEPSLQFAPSTVSRYERRSSSPAPRLFVNFLGLLGPNGPMPLHVTEYARDRERNNNDPTLARFLDMFNHRLLSLFYRAWAMAQQTVSHDRAEDDRYAVYIGSLFGVGMASLRDRDAVPDVAKLHYSGRLVCQTRHPEGLKALLEDYFGLQTELIEFIGRWVRLPDDCLCRMGISPQSSQLGLSCVVGSRIWDCQQKFRIRLGPMGLNDYERFLPGADGLRTFADWVRNYVADEKECDLQLVLKAEEVPGCQLGAGARMGWTSWLKTRPPERDADDLTLNPRNAVPLAGRNLS